MTAEGDYVQWYQGTGNHQPDLDNPQEPDYTVCSGGYKDTYYRCAVCKHPVTADGDDAQLFLGDDNHTIVAVAEKSPTAADAGMKAHYECSVCGQFFADAEGKEYADATDFLIPTLDAFIPGDISGDGNVDLNDVEKLFQFVSGQGTGLENIEVADVTGDDVIDLKDVTRLFQLITEQITTL
jgi:DNA-directed RNA polymerase subunit RPC12/RpoP